jgi:hypothetical protein
MRMGAVVALLVVACGTTSGGNPSGDGGSNAYSGSVVFFESADTTTFAVTAGFATGSSSASGCSGTQSGDCCLASSTVADAGTSFAASAGTIGLSANTTKVGQLIPQKSDYPGLTNPPTSTLTWSLGDTLKADATGAAVHAFSGSVKAVATLLAVNPDLSSTFTITRVRLHPHMGRAHGRR